MLCPPILQLRLRCGALFSNTWNAHPPKRKAHISREMFKKSTMALPCSVALTFFVCFSPSVVLLFSICATPLVKYCYFCFMMRPARQLSFQTRFWHVKKASRSAPVGSGAPMVCQYCVSFGRCRSICSSDVPKWPQMAPDSENCALIAR